MEDICQILKIPPVLANNTDSFWLSSCSDGGIHMSSSSQASVYNGFDLCTVYLAEGFRGKFRIMFQLGNET